MRCDVQLHHNKWHRIPTSYCSLYLKPLRQMSGGGLASFRPNVVFSPSKKWNTTPDSMGSSFRLTRWGSLFRFEISLVSSWTIASVSVRAAESWKTSYWSFMVEGICSIEDIHTDQCKAKLVCNEKIACMHACTHTPTHTHTDMHARTHAAHMHAHTHTHTHTHTQRHDHTCAHTHTHTHTLIHTHPCANRILHPHKYRSMWKVKLY